MNINEEVWKDIIGYKGLYQVSSQGRVKHIKYHKERMVALVLNEKGYLRVQLWKDRKHKTFRVHRLVAQTFIPNPDNLPEVNHKDECKTNNTVENLEWCTHSYNTNYGTGKERSAKKHSIKVLCVETGIIYQSAYDIQRKLGLKQRNIQCCCSGKTKKAYGYHWQYLNNL